MNREDVRRMARDAGMDAIVGCIRDGKYEPKVNALKSSVPVEWLESFAALVATAEREACVAILESHQIPVGNSPAGEMACTWTYEALRELRDTIRARGEIHPDGYVGCLKEKRVSGYSPANPCQTW